jgi:hypothetical protein
MTLEELSYTIETMFPDIIGGEDYLLQATVNPNTQLTNSDASIIMWNLPIEQPSDELLEDYFSQIKESFDKLSSRPQISDEDRRRKIVDNFLGKYGN